MVVSENRKQKLLEVLAKENSRKVPFHPPKSQFRSTILDTHQTAPTADFGHPFVNDVRERSACLTMNRRSHSAPKKARKPLQDSDAASSVVRSPSEQRFASVLRNQRRSMRANSEWALLDTLEVQLYNEETEMRRKAKQEAQDAQRRVLDHQMHVVMEQRRQEQHQRLQDAQALQNTVRLAQEREVQEAQARRAYELKVKADREQQLREHQLAKEEQRWKRAEEEARIMAEAKAFLEAEERARAEKTARLRDQLLQTQRENEEKLATKREAKLQARERDEAMMKDMIRQAELQEAERLQALHDFHENIAKRANKAGERAVAENSARAAREAALIAQFERQKELEAQEKERVAAEKRTYEKQAALVEREAHLIRKQEQIEQQKRQAEVARKEMEEMVRINAEREAAAERERRARALATRREQEIQMHAKHIRDIGDGIEMSSSERGLNAAAITQAQRRVGQRPRQIQVLKESSGRK